PLTTHSSAMRRVVGSHKEEFERLRRHQEAFAANSLEQLEPEPRVCLILNRFTMNLVVMHASSACQMVFNVDPDDITGKPFLVYLRSDDLAPFVKQMYVVKGTTAIVDMRFWFQSPNQSQEIPCEAIFIGTGDGILVIVRRCKPFFRKYLLGDRDISETISNSSSASGSYQSHYSPATSYSSASTIPTPPKYSYLSRSGLDKIKIVELEDGQIARSIPNCPRETPSLAHDDAVASLIPGFKEFIVQDFCDDDEDDDEFDANDDVDDTGVDETALKDMEVSAYETYDTHDTYEDDDFGTDWDLSRRY
ncbi:hypothetical protein BGX27_003249, partial [Mortierella sp. AM989]